MRLIVRALHRFLLIAVVLGVAAAAFTLIPKSKSETTPLPRTGATPKDPLPRQCLQLPKKLATPAWFPDDLPMPRGSYAADVPPAQAGLRRIVFASKGSLREFVLHVFDAWKKRGWTLGRGESEPGEAEDNFLKQSEKRYGVFRAREVYCEKGWIQVLLVINDPSLSPSPSPSASPSP